MCAARVPMLSSRFAQRFELSSATAWGLDRRNRKPGKNFTMPRSIGPVAQKSWLYNFFWTLMAMTLAYVVMTMTVSKCCYR